MPKVRVEQGQDLFRFVTPPPVQFFSSATNIEAQLLVGLSYNNVDFDDSTLDRFGGENCMRPTLDNKAIVLRNEK